MIMGSMLTSFTEGLSLSKSMNIPLDALLQVLDQGAMANPMFKGKGDAIIKGTYTTNFPLKHAQKDMGLALALAEKQGLSLPTATASNELYKKALAEGNGDEDFCAVFKSI